jgi:hypothetical protein
LRAFLDGLEQAGFVRVTALRQVRWTTTVEEALDACAAEQLPGSPPTAGEIIEASGE